MLAYVPHACSRVAFAHNYLRINTLYSSKIKALIGLSETNLSPSQHPTCCSPFISTWWPTCHQIHAPSIRLLARMKKKYLGFAFEEESISTVRVKAFSKEKFTRFVRKLILLIWISWVKWQKEERSRCLHSPALVAQLRRRWVGGLWSIQIEIERRQTTVESN